MAYDGEALAANVRMARARLDISQEQLSARSGVSRQAISKYESGDAIPGADKLVRIASALGCSTDELLGMEG